MRLPAVLLGAMAVLAGCGTSDERTVGDLVCGRPAAATDAQSVVDPLPAGYTVSPSGDPTLVDLTDTYKRTLGSRYAGSDSLVLTHQGTDDKVSILFVDTQHGVNAQKVVEGVEAEGRKSGRSFAHLDIGAQPGVIGGNDADGWAATAASGSCAIVVLIAPHEQLLRDVIAVIPKRS
jgi:hypothetical protein